MFNERTRLEYAREWENHQDRGRWFDGNDFVGYIQSQMDTFMIGLHKFCLATWINPASDGALFSYGARDDNIQPTYFHMGLRGARMEVEYSEGQFTHRNAQSYPRDDFFHSRRFYSSSDMDIITYGEWQYVQFSLIPNEIDRNTIITYSHNTVDRDTAHFDDILLIASEFSHPETKVGNYLIGAQDRGTRVFTDELDGVAHKQNLDLDNTYRGWMYLL